MGPKKEMGKAKGPVEDGPKASRTAKQDKDEKARRAKKLESARHKSSDVELAKEVSKKPIKKRSLILSLQSSPVMKERGKASEETVGSGGIQEIPKLKFGSIGRKRSPLIEASANGNYRFIEPERATPKPGYSGRTLESLPPLKAKRAAAAGKGRKYRAASARSSVEPLSEEQILQREIEYNKQLKTTESEKLTEDSKLRSDVLKLSRKRIRVSSSSSSSSSSESLSRSPSSTTIEIPPTPTNTTKKAGQNSPSFSVKRIKIISPKRSNALIGSTAMAEKAEVNSEPNDNDDFCSTCGGTGVFICCDTCPKSFHLLCCSPPLRDVPEENWNCNACRTKLGLEGIRVWNELGMFGPLVNSLNGRNPTEFRLPKQLRNDTFIGVSTGDGNTYMDVSIKSDKPHGKSNGAQIAGCNKDDSLNIDDLYDRDGNPHMCHKCGLSGLQRRTLSFCDYCPLSWHLDCLPEPMCSAKSKGDKWRCPNHVESLIPSFWTERRTFKDSLVLDAAAQNNILRFAQANNFLVKHIGQPSLDSKNSRLDQYQRLHQSFLSNDTGSVDRLLREAKSSPSPEDDTESGVNVTPNHLQNFSLENRIVAKASPDSARLFLMTNADDPHQIPFIYRVPEQQLVLDFLHSKYKKRAILQDISIYTQKAQAEEIKDMEAVNVLLALRENIHLHNQYNPVKTISADEWDELQHVRKLIQAKGKDALLQFLAS